MHTSLPADFIVTYLRSNADASGQSSPHNYAPVELRPKRVPNQRVAQHHPSGLKEATFGWRRLRPAVSFAAIYQDIIDALKLPRIAQGRPFAACLASSPLVNQVGDQRGPPSLVARADAG